MPKLTIDIVGRAERNGVITLTAALDDRALPADSVTWTAQPADAVELRTGGTARLLRAGTVIITARARNVTAVDTLGVAVPPSVVFDMLRDGQRDLWRVAIDGGDLQRLTNDAADDRDPSVAGGFIYFLSSRSGPADVHRMPLGGGTIQRITTAAGAKVTPAISPDAGRLAYAQMIAGLPKVFISTPLGADARRVTAGSVHEFAIEDNPGWAADGSRLVLMSTVAGNADIYSYTLASNVLESLVATSAPEVEPAWSHDGAHIAFASFRNGQTDLYLFNVATRATTRLTNRAASDGKPAWLRDGRIVFTMTGNPGALYWLDPAAPTELHVIETGGGTPGRAAAIH